MRIPWAKPEFLGNEQKYVNQAMSSTWISGGTFVDKLENDFSNILGSPYSVSTSNGTTAIHLAYLALNIRKGDEIIIPGFGFMAAANIALHMGAKPVFVDVDEKTFCMDPETIENKITKKTKAIVPIHTYGSVCMMEEIMSISEENNVPIIEDVAEAPFSKYKNRYAGTMGDLACFSFQATKTITTGEGGMVLTKNIDMYQRMQLFRNHGMNKTRYWHEVPGHNFRLTNIQAALGCAQLERLEFIIKERKRIHSQYKKHLSDKKGLRLQNFFPEIKPVLWAMAVFLDPEVFTQGRDRVIDQMNEEKIETRPGFYASSFLKIYDKHTLPISEKISRQIICLPFYISLENEKIEFICDRLKKLRN